MTRKRLKANDRTDKSNTQEWRQLVFDHYKQLSTLSGAGAAVLIAVYQQDIVDENLIGMGLALLGLSVLTSIMGMMRMVIWFPYQRSENGPSAPFLLHLSTSLLAAAIGAVLGGALDLPLWIWLSLLVLSVGAALDVVRTSDNCSRETAAELTTDSGFQCS